MVTVATLVLLAMLTPPRSDQRAPKKIFRMADRGINTRRDQPFIHKPLFVNRNIRRNNHGIRRRDIRMRKSTIDADRSVSLHLDRVPASLAAASSFSAAMYVCAIPVGHAVIARIVDPATEGVSPSTALLPLTVLWSMAAVPPNDGSLFPSVLMGTTLVFETPAGSTEIHFRFDFDSLAIHIRQKLEVIRQAVRKNPGARRTDARHKEPVGGKLRESDT